MIKVAVISFILIGMAHAASQMFEIIETEDGQFQLAIDSAMKQAIEKGEFQFPDNVVPIESKDCEGTQWIKQQECSLNGKSMDGTEGSCGPGKEIWILDQTHSDFKPATGDGKCEPQERDCSVECPKPCEGDTWKDTGKCVRKEYDTRGNMKKIVLDGTEGKCGEGITELTLDTAAPDYKPAVGKGECPMTKGGYCNVPCPKPEPPKCNSYTGWVENVGLGCVRSKDDDRKVRCGRKGVKMSFNVATDATNCPELVKWETCDGPPCPIDCEGSWSGWSAPKADEPCGVQPYKESIFTITTAAQHGGYACDYPHGDKRTRNSGTPKECCEQGGDWAKKAGSCNDKGLATYIQSFKENKPGGCPDSVKSKKMACCFQKGDWRDITGCNSVGRKTQQQTTAGNCAPSVKKRDVNCEYVGGWSKIGGCGADGKQWYSRVTVNSNQTTRKSENCCYPGVWGGFGGWSRCNGSTRSRTRYKNPVNCPPGTATSDTQTQSCNHCVGAWGRWSGWSNWHGSGCNRNYYTHRTRTYSISKDASNGGNECPHSNDEKQTETRSKYHRCPPEGCFISDTRIKLDNGDVVEIKDLMLGDVLEGGATVNATLQIRNVNKVPFHKVFREDLNDYIYVTGSHMIKENDKFVRVDECSFAEISDVVCDKFICLITDDHRIPIGGHIFRDWADTCDVCDTTTILE